MLGALTVHWPNGWSFTAPNGGWEYVAFLIAMPLAQALAGDGAFALRRSPWPGRRSVEHTAPVRASRVERGGRGRLVRVRTDVSADEPAIVVRRHQT
jgi:hypothetical protein